MALLLFLTPLYIGFLGIESYGLIGFYASWVAIFGILDMGISATATREIPWLSARTEEKNKIPPLLRSLEVAYWGVVIVLGATLLACSWLFGAAWFQAKDLSPELVQQALMLMAVSLVFQVPSGLYTGGLLGLQRQAQCAGLLALFGTLRGLGSIIVLWLITPDIRAFFLWQIVISVLQTGAIRAVLWRHIHADGYRAKFSWDRLRSVQGFAGGMTLITALSVVVSQADKMILSRVVSLDDFGHYMLAWSVASALMLVAMPVMQAFGPDYTKLVSVGDHETLAKRVRLASQLMSLIILPPAAFIMFLSEGILGVWLGNASIAAAAAPILSVMVAGTSLIACSYPALQVLYSEKHLGPVIRVQLLVMVVFLPALFFVVSHFGMMGAAYCGALFGLILFLSYRLLGLRRLLGARLVLDTLRDFVVPCAVSLLIAGLVSYWVAGITSKAEFIIATALALLFCWMLVFVTCKDLRFSVARGLKWA